MFYLTVPVCKVILLLHLHPQPGDPGGRSGGNRLKHRGSVTRRGLQLNYMLVVPSTIGLNNTHICELLIKIFYPMTPERHSDSRYLIRSNVLIMLRFTADFFFTFQLIFKNSLIFFCKTCNNYDKCLIY